MLESGRPGVGRRRRAVRLHGWRRPVSPACRARFLFAALAVAMKKLGPCRAAWRRRDGDLRSLRRARPDALRGWLGR